MKKLGFVISIIAILVIAGCASSGGGKSSGGDSVGAPPYRVDLSTLKVSIFSYATKGLSAPVDGFRNKEAFTRQYDGAMFILPELPVDVTKYARVTIMCKYFNADGEEIAQGDSNAMVVIAYDINGDLEGPAMGAGPNTPLKEFNVGGFSGIVSTDKGSRIRLSKAPGGVLFQSSNGTVKYIEVTQITFHNSTASAEGSADASPAAAVGADAPVGVAAAVAAIPDDGKPKIAVYVTSSDRSIAARALSGLGAFNTVGDGLAKAISETEKGHGVNLTNEITKAYGANVGISQANAVGQTYGVQYLCVVTISNVKGKAFNLGIDIVDVSKSQKTASSSGAVDMGNPVGMLQNIGKMSLDISSGIALNAVLN